MIPPQDFEPTRLPLSRFTYLELSLQVLGTFPSRYCSAIGLTEVLALGGFTTRLRLQFQATRLQGDRIRIEPSSYGPRTALGNSPASRGLAAESVSGTLTPKRHISPRPCERGIRRRLSRFNSPVLLGNPVGFSFLRLLLLKFSGLFV
ncbi:hypothetical protein JTE90_007356 [Oedothorax gibbosus]|uniref:Uncharacterized protein n=1 Tax=Oedothorax gibbosus TaxID=931172 RepID=A0AAV6TEP2_9ARAC|nr:hypothetical protein JTE90_007356 [Oedothorax gibbosus]